MRQVRTETSSHREKRRRPHRALLAAAAVSVLALVGGGSFVLGHQSAASAITGQGFPADGTHISSSSATAGAQLTAVITPATGWVRVTAHVTGIPSGELCNLIVVDHMGSEHIAASWRVSPNPQGTTLTGATVVASTDVAAVTVKNFDGHEFVTATV
jgi:hypothetical protein